VTAAGASGFLWERASGPVLNLIDAVCQIKWPAAQEQVASEQAAILFKARDKLNQLASPATGLTIAYTLLVAPDARGGSQFSSKDKVPFCNGYPHSFARRAYPHLIESAQRCRKWIDRLPMLMILALIVTTLLSWYVSYGKFILLRIEQLDSQRAEIAAAYKPGDHLSTFGGNPVSCAASLANIEFIEQQNLPTRATETGDYAMAKLRELQKNNPLIGEVRGLGLMIGVELVKDEKLTPATPEAEAVRDGLLRQGVLVGVGGVYGNVIRFQPPLIITRPQIDRAIEAFAAALQEVAQPAHA